MKLVFADTSYFVAQLDPQDDHNAAATRAAQAIGTARIVTSEMILAELLNHFSKRGEKLRAAASEMVDRLRGLHNVEIAPQTSDLFRKAHKLYASRRDKKWGLTDCASFKIMEERGISEALTHDEHFEQAGYRALMRVEGA